MQSIEVDFEVYKQLTIRRATEQVSYNEVVRELLGLDVQVPRTPSQGSSSAADWVAKGVRFPAGTEFRAAYKGKQYFASVEGGALVLNGKSYETPSAAAMSIADSAVNGWGFWECRFPGQSSWKVIKTLRKE
ncbi:MAG: DUF2924 domain-containing protein [Betaproteobacteria bacterium]|nr:DUF2924 domain-containing protein [Betaproteobacteria bacterium]MDE2124367.1 DUF2924 domain-containing protein [Betaproteobacteria bacterium]MDE2187495.1 DUF2924 domain-containing protein [Betaproteobacteria bacterium]MDE2323283.1 DUF2924 domain-containing protein [Betaproteobacteria bacterium]